MSMTTSILGDLRDPEKPPRGILASPYLPGSGSGSGSTEAPLTDYEKQKMEQVMRNSRIFRSLGIQEAANILKNSRPKGTNTTREDSGSLYQPEDGEDVEQGAFDKEAMLDLEPEVSKSSTRTSKRVMAVAHQGQDDPARITRQRTRELALADEVPIVHPQDGRCITKRHMGRDLDMISRGLRAKIPVNISEGKLRPEEPLQAAKLASEAGIILRDHVPIFTHWKHYKEDAAKPLVRNYNDKLSSQFTIDKDVVPWKQLVDMWSNPKHKEKCLKNKGSRELVQYHQMTGSRSYVAQCYVMKQTKFKDAPPTAIDIFKDTHCSSKSGFNEQAMDAIAQMEAYVAEPTEEGQDPKTPVQAIAHVMPKSTFLHNVGMQSAAMKRNAKAAAMNDRVNELESELQAEKKGSDGLRSQLADVQKQLEDQKEAARKNEEAARRTKKKLRS
uniref:Uncharacterized protein n=1 Tax=Sorghum bicolor TaxID=4558 RepID=B3VTC4_SORBI|nr:hypothetical protein [Sorghum bicolor]